MRTYDFSGWATRNDLKCADGRVIRRDAFKHNDGKSVPLVWNHQHNEACNVLGHADLENRPEGVYAYCTFNDTEYGKNAKELVKHGDITALSIYANQLKQVGSDVIHGAIKEVSLVLAGANPGAYIENVLEHSFDSDDFEAYIETISDDGLYICHADATEEDADVDEDEDEDEEATETVQDIFDSMTERQKLVSYVLIGQALADAGVEPEDMPVAHSDFSEFEDYEEILAHADSDTETVRDIFDSMTDKQKTVLYALIGQALDDAGVTEDDLDSEDEPDDEESEEDISDNETDTKTYVKHSEDTTMNEEMTVQDVFDTLDEDQKTVVYALIGQALEDAEEEADMKHNLFDNEYEEDDGVLSHSEMMAVIDDAKHYGSLKESALAHGIENIGELFPQDHTLDTPPQWIKRETGWVDKLMNAVHHTPFSRIRSVFADITEADARAKGYLADHTHRDAKGNLVDADGNPVMKKEEVFGLLKRTTGPTTVYKKQKLDRDDVVDITDFDVVSWLKGEMRMQLDEEIARAVLVGDGRASSSDDKINETCIRPIWTDAALFTIKADVEVTETSTSDEIAKKFIRAVIKSRKNYKGSGTPTLFTTEDMLTDCLLMEDQMGRIIYDTEEKLRSALRVKEIVTVPVMEGRTRQRAITETHSGEEVGLLGIVVNPADYNVGADKGGSVNLFDDFDIDYNAQKYLIETRCSGALIKPYSAIAIESVTVNP